jgi:hypothetical protein
MGSENAHRCAQNAVNGFGLDFLEQYHKEGDELLYHVIRGDETRVSFVNVETKEKSKQWMHTHSLNKPKILNKLCLPIRKLMSIVFWDRNGVLVVEFMQQRTTSVL